MKRESIEFYETQRFCQWWMWLIMIGINAIFLLGCVQQLLLQKPFGDNPVGNMELIIVTAVILLVTALLFAVRLHTYVNAEGVYVRFFPLQFRAKFYDWNNIQAAYVRKYNPMTEFGGWGYKVRMNAGKVYSMSGNRGLQLVLMNGKKVLIGTRQPEQLTKILIRLGKMKN